MKLSIAWIFDHINADWKTIDVPALIEKFNQTTAEIEGFTKLSVNLDAFTLAQVIDVEATTLHSPEWKKDVQLSARKNLALNQWYLIKHNNKKYTWATAQDLLGGKEHVLPALHCSTEEQKGGWKKLFENDDYILDIDNKSITNRPDMWGHRGVAREVAAMLNLELKPLEQFVVKKDVKEYTSSAPATADNPIAITVKNSDVCKRFAGLFVPSVEHTPSVLWMMHRLVRVDSKPIDFLVDATNYVMLDVSQPMHAFDAALLLDKTIVPRMAKNKEKLTLLDEQEVELTSDDLVITDGKKPIALGGVMGGLHSGISASTKSMFIESANFDATTIRRTSTRIKTRTEASARFEKSLDPNQNVTAIVRFLKLLHDQGINIETVQEIASVGALMDEPVINVTHEFLEQRLGATLAPDFVTKTLRTLEFKVQDNNGEYSITVPSFRATKDISIKEDIVEEVARFFGYTNITHELPRKYMCASDTHEVQRTKDIKHFCADALQMRELQSYALHDEQFLQAIKWQPNDALAVKEPVSENWQRLVTSLVPQLLHAVQINAADYNQLRFFEWARVWGSTKNKTEKKTLSGVMFDQKNAVGFYASKQLLERLFAMLQLDVAWVKVDNPEQPWYVSYQTADLLHNNTKIGTAGKVHPAFMHNVCEGDAFIFELDGDYLLSHHAEVQKFVAPSKYPDIERDISFTIALRTTVDALTDVIKKADTAITDVALVDFFEKPEWGDKKSLTFRFIISDATKTLTKDEADAVWSNVAQKLKKVGAEIR